MTIQCAKDHQGEVARQWPAHSCVQAKVSRCKPNDLLRIVKLLRRNIKTSTHHYLS